MLLKQKKKKEMTERGSAFLSTRARGHTIISCPFNRVLTKQSERKNNTKYSLEKKGKNITILQQKHHLTKKTAREG